MCCLTWQGQKQPHRSCCQQWACWGCGPSPHTPGQDTAAQLATSLANSYHVKTEEGLKERVSGVHHVGPPVDEDWRVAQTVDSVRSADGYNNVKFFPLTQYLVKSQNIFVIKGTLMAITWSPITKYLITIKWSQNIWIQKQFITKSFQYNSFWYLCLSIISAVHYKVFPI